MNKMRKSFALILNVLIVLKSSYNINCNENIFVSGQKNVYYIESEQKFTWFDSLAKCASMNMSLVTIDTKLKSQDVTNLLLDIFGKKIVLWIGGCVNGANLGQFVWIATGKKFVYTNWAAGQPDFDASNEYCAQTGWNDNMEWNDHVCSNQFGFICEYSRLHECEEKFHIKLMEEMKKQQQIEIKEMLDEIPQNRKTDDCGDGKSFRDLIFNINQNPK